MFKKLTSILISLSTMLSACAYAATTPNVGYTYLISSQSQPEVSINANYDINDKAVSGLGFDLTLAISGAVTLTTVQASHSPWIFNGTPSGTITITVPAKTFVKTLSNNTGQNLTFTTGSGATVTVATGVKAIIYSDGTNIYLVSSSALSFSGNLDVAGTISAYHFKGTTSAPSITAGTGSGTGGSCSVSGTDASGQITINTGTAPSSSATICTLTYSTTYGSTARIVISSANAASAALLGSLYADSNNANFAVYSTTPALSGSSTYKLNYLVIQ